MFDSYEKLSIMREFLLSIPFPTPYNEILIDHGQIIESQGSDRFGEGAALVSTGDNIVSRSKNTWGIVTLRKRWEISDKKLKNAHIALKLIPNILRFRQGT